MKEIAEDLLKLIYAYQDMHSKLGITSDQSPSVSRAEEWIAAQQSAQADGYFVRGHTQFPARNHLWRDPNKNIEIMEASDDEQETCHRFGSDTVVLSPEHIKALQDGKMLAWNDSEYSTFVVLANDQIIQNSDGSVDRFSTPDIRSFRNDLEYYLKIARESK